MAGSYGTLARADRGHAQGAAGAGRRRARVLVRGLDDATAIRGDGAGAATARTRSRGRPTCRAGRGAASASTTAAPAARSPRSALEGFGPSVESPRAASCATVLARLRRASRSWTREPSRRCGARSATSQPFAAEAGPAGLAALGAAGGWRAGGRRDRAHAAGARLFSTGAAGWSGWPSMPAERWRRGRDPRRRRARRRPRDADPGARCGARRGAGLRAAAGAARRASPARVKDSLRPASASSIPAAWTPGSERSRHADQLHPRAACRSRYRGIARRSCAPACIAASAPRPARPTCCWATSSTARAAAST